MSLEKRPNFLGTKCGIASLFSGRGLSSGGLTVYIVVMFEMTLPLALAFLGGGLFYCLSQEGVFLDFPSGCLVMLYLTVGIATLFSGLSSSGLST